MSASRSEKIPEWIQNSPEGCILKVQAQPGASRSEVIGPHGDPPRLKIRIAAPPVEGAANEELLRFLKKAVRVSGARFELLRGETSRSKDVICKGVSATHLLKLLP